MSRIDRNVVKNELIETGEADKIEKDLKEWEENQQKRRKSRKESGSGSSSSGSKRDSKKEKERLRKEEEENAKAKQEQVKRQLFEKKQSLDEEVKRLEEERRTRDEERRRRREERRRAHEEEKKKNEAELAAIDEKIKKKEANKDDPAKKVKSPRTDEEKGHRGKSPHRRSLPCNDMNEKGHRNKSPHRHSLPCNDVHEKGKRTKSPRRSSISENKSPRKKDKEKDKEKKKKSDKRASRVASPRSRKISIQFPDPTPDDLIERKRLEEYKRIRNMDDSRFFSLDEVPLVECTRLTPQDLFQCDYAAVDHRKLRAHLLREGKITMQAAEIILTEAAKAFREEPTLLRVKAPVCVFGDIHGQFQDLCVLLDKTGDPAEKQMLFLGDYVDRGMFSIETVFYLFALKISYPDTFRMMRGNHETRLMTEYFNFQIECVHKYNQHIYDLIMLAFDNLPIAAHITTGFGNILAVHGGLGPENETVEQIEQFTRFGELPNKGPLCDLIWADPADEGKTVGFPAYKLEEWQKMEFTPNTVRGCSWIYGLAGVRKFLDRNNLVMLIRAHEVQKFGYTEHRFKDQSLEYPPVISLFSAPNYCDMYENRAAVMLISNEGYDFIQSAEVPHPYDLPDWCDVFTWSLPFVAENMSRFCLAILEIVDDCEEDEDEETDDGTRDSLRQKIKEMGRTMIILKNLREKNEEILSKRYMSNLETFEKIVQSDRTNEAMPKKKKLFRTISSSTLMQAYMEGASEVLQAKEKQKTGASIRQTVL